MKITTLLVLKICIHKNSSNKVKQQARGKIANSLPRNEFVKSINKSLDLKKEIRSELKQSLCKLFQILTILFVRNDLKTFL